MTAVLAWIAADRAAPVDSRRFSAALARLAARGPVGCRVHQQPGFAVAVLLAGIPAEQQVGEQPRVCDAAAGGGQRIGVLDGWLIEPADLARQLGIERGAEYDHLALWMTAHQRQGNFGLAAVRGHYLGLLYDAACHELLVQRDPGGARALYFRVEPAGCWFASDESALLEGDLDAALDPAALVRYFAAWAPQPGWGWFRDVQAVRPGEQWSFNGVRATLQQTLRPPRIVPAKRDAQAIEQYAELLRQAVARSVAGVVGVPALSLSSGLDSQTVAAQLHLLQQPFVAHSWILPSHPASDETDGIHGLIEAWGVPWRHFDGSGAEPLGTDQQWPRPQVCGELFANLYRELKHRLYKSVRADGQRLLLNGDAGDHLYGNPVDWFVHSLQAHRYADVLGELAARVRAQGFALRRDPALRRMASWLLQRRVRNYAPQDFTAPAARTLLDGARLEFADSRERLLLGTYTTRALAAESAYSEPLGLEIRSPLRDPDLLGFALQLRPALSQRAGERKWVARAALRGQLPEESRTRQKSGDLSHFLRASLRGPLLQRWRNLLDQPNARWSQIVQRSSVEHTLAYAQSASETALLRLWLCVAFEQWRSACAYGTQVPTMEVVPSTART